MSLSWLTFVSVMAGILGEFAPENILPVFGFKVNAGMHGCHACVTLYVYVVYVYVFYVYVVYVYVYLCVWFLLVCLPRESITSSLVAPLHV